MIEFLNQILVWVETLGRDLFTSINAIAGLVYALPNILITYSTAIAELPTPILLYATLTITISVVFLIIGR